MGTVAEPDNLNSLLLVSSMLSLNNSTLVSKVCELKVLGIEDPIEFEIIKG